MLWGGCGLQIKQQISAIWIWSPFHTVSLSLSLSLTHTHTHTHTHTQTLPSQFFRSSLSSCWCDKGLNPWFPWYLVKEWGTLSPKHYHKLRGIPEDISNFQGKYSYTQQLSDSTQTTKFTHQIMLCFYQWYHIFVKQKTNLEQAIRITVSIWFQDLRNCTVPNISICGYLRMK